MSKGEPVIIYVLNGNVNSASFWFYSVRIFNQRAQCNWHSHGLKNVPCWVASHFKVIHKVPKCVVVYSLCMLCLLWRKKTEQKKKDCLKHLNYHKTSPLKTDSYTGHKNWHNLLQNLNPFTRTNSFRAVQDIF